MPLLHRSARPRVLSILNGTKERRINESDIGLEKEWGMMAVVNHSTLLTSLAFDYLAANDDQKRIAFIHATPGLVHTGTPSTNFPSKKNGWLNWALVSTLQIVVAWATRLFGFPVQVSGERHAYYLTSDNFQPGSWRVDRHCEIVPDNSVLKEYLKRGWPEKAWEHTQGTWDKALSAR